MLHMICAACEAEACVEGSSSHVRSDLAHCDGRQAFVMGLKAVDDESQPDSALDQAPAQIRDKGCHGRYEGDHRSIHHVAPCFGREKRNLPGIRANPA